MEALEHEQKLATAVAAKSEAIRLALRPADPFAHGLVASRITGDHPAVLLRVRLSVASGGRPSQAVLMALWVDCTSL